MFKSAISAIISFFMAMLLIVVIFIEETYQAIKKLNNYRNGL